MTTNCVSISFTSICSHFPGFQGRWLHRRWPTKRSDSEHSRWVCGMFTENTRMFMQNNSLHVRPVLPSSRHPESAQNAVQAASTHVCTLYVPADETVRMYEHVGSQMKELIALPAFPGSPYGIVMNSTRPALVVSQWKAGKHEVFMSDVDGATWTAWWQLTRSHTDKLCILSICMPTPNILLAYDHKSHSVKQYELA